MKQLFLNAFVAVCLMATLNACSKEEQADLKPLTLSLDPRDPGNYGYYQVVTDEIYFYRDSITDYSRPTEHYMQHLKPLSLEKYKNGALLDSLCNKDLAVYFESKALKTQDKSALWAVIPAVSDEHPPILSVKSADYMFKMKTSKMVTGFGFEINSPYKGLELGVNVSYWNSKLNQKIPHIGGTRYLNGNGGFDINFGISGGARVFGAEVPKKYEFDEIRITFEPPTYGDPNPVGPFDISFSGFRYKLDK